MKDIFHYLTGIVVGLIIGFGSYMGLQELSRHHPDDFMIVDSVYVPDHGVGEDPFIDVIRTILIDHQSDWFVEFQKFSDKKFRFVCVTNKHRSDYATDEELPEEITLHDWWTYNECKEKMTKAGSGDYRIITTWTPQLGSEGEGPPIRKTSNVFTVYGEEK